MTARWPWRAAVLGAAVLVMAALPVRADASGGGAPGGSGGGRDERGRADAQHQRDDARARAEREREAAKNKGPKHGKDDKGRTPAGVERYNPDIDGGRVVFTQVDRRNGTTKASIWSRDLASGAETLVADVATGEPYPVAGTGWTAWSEAGPGVPGTSIVRARAVGAGSRVIDVFATDYPPSFFTYPGNPDQLLPVDLSGNHLVTTNGLLPGTDGTGKQLVRVDLPSTRPTFVDVMTTVGATFAPGVAQSGTTSVVPLDNGTLFSVVDGSGRVIASPTAGDCIVYFGGGTPPRPAIDGTRVAQPAVCLQPALGAYVPSIVTCTLPCDTVDALPIVQPFGYLPASIALSGSLAVWSSRDGDDTMGVYALDLVAGGAPRLVHRASGAIGPRVAISGTKVVWDETTVTGGQTRSSIYLRDLATGRTTILAPGGTSEVVPEAAGPLRLNPDVLGGRLAYTEVARDGSSAGIWTRSLTGSPSLVSTMATDSSVPRLGTGVIAWNTRDPGAVVERVVATDRPGGALVDVYSTDLGDSVPSYYGPDFVEPVRVDVGGSKAVVTGYSYDPAGAPSGFPLPQPSVFAKDLPAGPLTYLAPVIPSSYGGFVAANDGRTNGRYSAAIEATYPGVVDVFDGATLVQQLTVPSTSPYGPTCYPGGVDVTATRLVMAVNCNYPEAAALLWCSLPCAAGLTGRVTVPADPGTTFAPYLTAVSASGDTVMVTRAVTIQSGRYGDRWSQATEIDQYDIGRGRGPTVVTVESGVVGQPQVDGGTVTWSVDRWEGGRTGTVYVRDLQRGRTSTV